MLEQKKDDSDNLQKYKAMLISTLFAAIIVFLAPSLILIMTGSDSTDEASLITPPAGTLPEEIEKGIKEMYDLIIWAVRLVLVVMVIVSVMMMCVNPVRITHVKRCSVC